MNERDGRNERVLLVGATGTVGGEALRATLERGGRVRAFVRSASAARRLGAGVEAFQGDLRDDTSLARAFEGVSAALYVSPHEPDEEALADRFARACARAGARLVFVGVHVDGANRISRALKRLFYGALFAHYLPKFRLSERVRTGHPDAVVLMPPSFFQNDELFLDEILAGELALPFEKPLSRVDVRDLGDAIARALLDRSVPAGAHPVVGPASLSAADCARVWSDALGREVRWVGQDDARVRAALGRTLSGKKLEDFVATFRLLRSFDMETTAADVAATTALIGHAPRSYEQYVRDLVAARAATPARLSA